MTLPTALWCREQALIHTEYEKQYLKEVQMLTANEYRDLALVLHIAARALDEKAEHKIHSLIASKLWTCSYNGKKIDIEGEEDAAEAVVAYLKEGVM